MIILSASAPWSQSKPITGSGPKHAMTLTCSPTDEISFVIGPSDFEIRLMQYLSINNLVYGDDDKLFSGSSIVMLRVECKETKNLVYCGITVFFEWFPIPH